MKADLNTQHPYIQQLRTLAERDVILIGNVRGLPIIGDSYISSDMFIILCHEGMLRIDNMSERTFKAHDVAILLPDHIAVSHQVSADYCSTMIAISRKFHDHLQHTYPYTRYAPRYRQRPVTHLTDEQYKYLLNAIEVLRSIEQSQSAHRFEMLSNMISIILNMIGECNIRNHPNNSFSLSPKEQLFNRFYEAIIQHHRESHEMAFYARICCLSPKHFSEVIKKDTGFSPKEWIAYYLAARAKILLDSRDDYTIQQISNLLGFSEQSSFARFFKTETGMSPREYRSRRQ